MGERFTVGLIVSNHFGVLNRISGLYGKRGFNIDSLAVGVTEDPRFSRMTIVSTGDENIRSQVVKQLNKLHDVKKAVLLEDDKSISLEHLMIKLKTNGSGNAEIVAHLNSYGGKVLDIGDGYVTADLTASTDRVNEFIEKCVPSGYWSFAAPAASLFQKAQKNILSIQ